LALARIGRGVVHQALLGSVTLRVPKEAACDILIAIKPMIEEAIEVGCKGGLPGVIQKTSCPAGRRRWRLGRD